jgi:PAS domain S-box-containing protein
MRLSNSGSFYARTGLILLVSAAFLVLAHYLKAFTDHNLFTVLFPAVALSAWVGGRLGGLLSTATLALGTAYYHLPPQGFAVADPDDVVRLGTFTLSGAFVAWLSGALKESQGVIKATLESIGDAVIATDRRGRVRLLNPTAEMLTGWSHKDARGRPLSEVFRSVHTETGEAVPVPQPDSIRSRTDLRDGVSLVSRNGTRVQIDDSIAPVQIDTGRTMGSILVFRDATRRKQAEAGALELERHRLRGQRMEAVGRLAGGVAHDFNNLLTVINGYADLLLQQVDQASPFRGNAEAIRKAGDRAASLTRQLLVFSRGQPAKLEIADLNRIVADFDTMLRRLIGEDIDLVVNLAAQPLRVRVDIGQIEQIIMNLAANARDAMPHGGRLTLEIGLKELQPNGSELAGGEPGIPYAELAVVDTGIGMSQETLARLFEPFFTTKGIHSGTGLGLSVTYGIVKSHNGHVRVESLPDRGSTFRVYLPLTDAPPEQAPAPARLPEPAAARATILLVEDNREVRQLMRDILSASGYVVMEASGVEEAMAIAETRKPIDGLVSDIVMPGFSGVELGRRLASIRPGLNVLYVSGYSNQELASRALEDSKVAYLQKPFAPSELTNRVAEAISRSRKRSSS